jgi:hypothetical protein
MIGMTRPKLDPAKEQNYREEAKQLALLSIEDQREIIAIYRACAKNPKTPKQEREWGLARVRALERHLRQLNRVAGKSRNKKLHIID